ncbi:autotransporter-associated beta strand repeat-containing protein [Bradyrhizobium diazoefficiens]|uniref:beta strand repeat-containing protein n=1 Tax=Bradyrhizobium diazoefficiens TaxID=1355477 RepID=UPI00190C5834|nr:autotransporter domain-containing protein [Bradyrhizobium diazoefficiens]QQO31720.1 autotransporter-associated beta strand repeat-containing protein [Bradyrhizobium diazoefficiens]
MRAALLTSSALALAWALPAAGPARAQDATWLATPGSGDFNTGANWDTGTVPTSTAFFGASSTTGLTISAGTTVDGWTLNAGGPAYTFTINQALNFFGAGIDIQGGSATITNNSNLLFYNSSTAGSAAIANNGALNFSITSTAGSATITNNNYLSFDGTSSAGSATITNNSILYFYNTSTAGNATIANNSVLYFFDSSTAGNATITNNINFLEFYNTSTAGNATITNNGGLNFYDTSTAGNATITNNSFLHFYSTSTAGSATITNTSHLYFNDTSTAGNATITNNSFLYFYNSGTAGNATITNNNYLSFNDASTAGSATITNNSGLHFSGTSTAGSATIINNAGGTVDFSGGTGPNGDNKLSAGSIAGAGNYILGANELTVGSNDLSTEVSGVIFGAGGSLVKTGTGTLTLSGINTYTGGTTISTGTLQLGNGGGTGSIAGNVVNNGVFAFNRTGTLTLAGDISGSGAVQQIGAGTTILTGNNTYSGGTTISAGTLQLGNGGATGSIVGNVVNDGVLAFNRTGTLTLAGDISGSGAVQQIGTGTTILTGTNSYTGDTTVSGGTLQFGDGSSGGGNSLGGNLTVTSGTLAIQTPATLNVAQTVTFADNTALSIIAGASSPALSADRVAIGNGVAFNISGISDASQLDKVLIDTTSGISGDFAAVTVGGFSGTVDYLTVSTHKSADSLQYLASYGLSWTAGNDLAHGTFTLTNTADSFTVGTALADQAANAATGWNGTSLTKAGAGTLILTADNTYSGGTTINAGTLQLGNGGTAGSILGAVTVGASGTFDVVNADTSGITSISNSGHTYFRNGTSAGSATITNNNLVQFNDTSTAGSAAITNNTATFFYDGSSAGSATIANYASLYFYNSSTAGSATVTNNGYLGFYSTSTAGSATITNNNYLYFTGTSTAGSAAITNNTATLFYDGSSAGSATITNYALLYFYNSSTAGSAAITNNGSLGFFNTSTAGSATITNNNNLGFYSTSMAGSATITNNNYLYFNDTSTAGNATIINNAGGTVDFSGSIGPNGDNKLSAGSIAGAGNYILGANELTVGSNDLSTEVSGIISGVGGSLVKTSTGTLTLSGINTYTGATTVNGGTLAVNSDITASSGVTVNGGGTLGGTGQLPTTVINSGGTLAPGNSIGTITVSGNLTFNAGSFYTVEVSPSAADRTNVTGTATLTGATVQAVALPGSFRAQTYTILNATGGFGGTQFAGITGSSFAPGARNPHLTYDANDVYLVLDPGTLQLSPGASGNQTSVAGAINNFVENGGTPPAGFDVLLNMSGSQQANALNQVSGQPGAGSAQASFNAMQQFLGMLDPLGGGSTDGERGTSGGAADGGALGYAATAQDGARVREAYAAVTPRGASGEVIDRRWGVWASGYGGASTLSGNAATGSSSTTSRIYGTVVGADYRLSPDTLLGFALGGAGFNFSVADALGGGRADVFQAGLYAHHNFGPAYVSAALAYGWQDVTTDRTVTVSGTDRLTANFKASTSSGRLETGWRFVPLPASTFGVTPYAAVQATTFHLPGYGETAIVGSNQFALSYTAQDTTNIRTELGGRTDQRFLVDDGVLTLRGRLAWAHDTNTNRLVSAAFQTLPGAAFTVNGARPAADSALVSGRAEMKWRNGLSLAGTVEGEFSRSTQTYTGKGTVRYEW